MTDIPDAQQSFARFIVGCCPDTDADDAVREFAGRIAQSCRTLVRFGAVVSTTEQMCAAIREANDDEDCVGVVVMIHSCCPGGMWIPALKLLQKPLLHLLTQPERDLPWNQLDSNFMANRHSAHGGREFAHICHRMGVAHKTVVGFFDTVEVRQKIDTWLRVCRAWGDQQKLRIVRFGDNRREAALTEGDKVAARIVLGYSVEGYPVEELLGAVNAVSDKECGELVQQYYDRYLINGVPAEARHILQEAARLEIGLGNVLRQGNFGGFTTTLTSLRQLNQFPGLAAQHLMAQGFGFAADGDWRTAALVRLFKVMGSGLPGGSSFMEDYAYHFEPQRELVLGARLLEVCPTLADDRPILQLHRLVGDPHLNHLPARLVFHVAQGRGANASIVEEKGAFKLLVNYVEVETPENIRLDLPVARALWRPLPDLESAVRWFLEQGGTHHLAFTNAVGHEEFADYCRIAGIPLLEMGAKTGECLA